MSDTSGPPSRTPFAYYDPATSCWRTSQGTLFEDSDRYSETWPRSGMTRAGCAYELPTPALPTAGNVSSSLLGTPRVSMALGPGRWEQNGTRGRIESQVDQLLKTPTAQLAVNGGSRHPDKRRAGGHGPTLADEVEFLFPTPRATDGTKGGPNQRGSSGDLMLPSAVQLLPTPIAGDGKGGRNATAARLDPNSTAHHGMTLGDWIRLRGVTTPPRSTDGNESQDELPLHPPSQDEQETG